MSPSKKVRVTVSDAPMAVLSSGEVALSVTHLDGMAQLIAKIEKLVPVGHEVFIGLVVPRELRTRLIKELDDSVADVIGRVGTLITGTTLAAPAMRGAGVLHDYSGNSEGGGRPCRWLS